MWTLMRRLGTWMHDWPCDHEHHAWGLYRPGMVMWYRDCAHCDLSGSAVSPARNECDLTYYKDVYEPKHATTAE